VIKGCSGAAARDAVDGAVNELLKELEVTLYSRFSTVLYERQNTQNSPRSFFRGEDLLYQILNKDGQAT
jgi:hypothetical protein